MTKTTKTITVGFVLLVSLILGFMFNTVMVSGQSLETGHPPADRALIFDQVADAEEAVGYKLSSPGYIPPGFERGNIVVMQHSTVGGEKGVVQTWNRASDGAFIFLEESPLLKGIIGGEESVDVRGKSGIRSQAPPLKGRPFAIDSIFWRGEGRGIFLTRSIMPGLDRRDIQSVADSVGLR